MGGVDNIFFYLLHMPPGTGRSILEDGDFWGAWGKIAKSVHEVVLGTF